MAAIAFDTLKFANRLKEAGVPDKQAEAQATTMGEALAVNLDGLATKEQVDRQGVDSRKEILQIRTDLTREIDLLRSDVNREFQAVRQENQQTKTELLQAMSQVETRQNGQIQLLRWMVTVAIALLTGLFIRLMFFSIH